MIALGALVLEVKPLAVLASWQPVGARLESLVDASRGLGSLSEFDVSTLRAWARRWSMLPEPVRAFYVLHLDDEQPTARTCLWRVLHGRRPLDWQVRRLESMWQQDTGALPMTVTLCPVLR